MRRILKKFIKNEKGQSVVEFAITLPVLLLVLCAIIDFGWIFSNKMLITFSSREGARYGIVKATEEDAVTLISDKTLSVVPTYLRDDTNVNVEFSDITNVSEGDITVTVTSYIKALTPLRGIFVSDQTIILTSECTMKVE